MSYPGPCHPPLERLLSLVRAEEEDACIAAEAALREASPATRAHLLVKTDCTPLPPRLVEWLFARWHSEDRQLLVGERPWGHDCNLWVAITHRARPEARKLLVDWTWNRTTGALEECPYRELADPEREQLQKSVPRLLHRFAESLVLRLPELVAHHGTEALLRQIIRAQNVACRVPYALVKGPPEFPRAVELLGEWRDARALLYQLLCDFQVVPEVRTALVGSLFENDRAAASRWALAALRYPDNAEPVHQGLCLAANAPTPEDRPLFLMALRGTDDVAH